MIRSYLTVLLISFFSHVLWAQTFSWKGYLHGLHPLQFEMERKGTWLIGEMITPSDTFTLEGSWNGKNIDLLEFHDGLWTAKIQLRVQDEGKISGYWIPRLDSQVLYIELGRAQDKYPNYYYWHNEQHTLSDLYLSPTSGLDYFGHAYSSKEDSFQTYYLSSYLSGPVIGLSDSTLSQQLKDIVHGNAPLPAHKDFHIWPSLIYKSSNYHTLVEVITPITGATKVDQKIEKWADEFKELVQSQMVNLSLRKDQTDWDKKRWTWNAFAYVELYSRSEKCWSFALHTSDIEGNTDIQSLHYFPQKNELFLLRGEIKNYDRLQEVIGEDWEELIFHPHGLITLHSFKEQKGIQREFHPDRKVRRYFRLFSPLKWIK